ncbi:MAG: FlgD immunoglobulin-like domain containing protein, partial [Candidatus Eisenbacteria bacterium]
SLQFSRLSPPLFRPDVDAGAAFECRVLGTGTCSPTGEVASLRSLYLPSNTLQVSSSFAGMCADQESVYVSQDGLLVASFAMPPSHAVFVSPPSGGPLGMAINEKGLPGEKKPNTSTTNNPKRATPVGGESSASVVGADGLSLHVSFLDTRVVCVDGTCVSGDDITFHGECASGTCSSSGSVITITGQDFSLERCSSGACSPSSSSLHISNSVSSGVDQVRASAPPSLSLSSSSLVAMVPVVIDRASSSSSRGTSVTFHLSSNLVLASSVVEYDYFSSSGTSQMFVVDNGGGSYTVDCALLGPGCGPSSSGTLFALPVSRAPGAPDGLASVTVDACEVADCNGAPIPARSGGAVYILLDSSAPSPPTVLATQVKTGNDGSGLTRTNLQLGSLAVEDGIELYRASFGNYPLYEDGPTPGSIPVVSSSSPPAAPWEPVSLSGAAAGAVSPLLTVLASKRGYDYYMVRSVDRAGNVSSSVMSNGVLSYHLGDVAGGPPCGGDNQVTTADISSLGAAYGSSFSTSSSLTCLDIGPTVDGTIDGRPSPDQRLSFRDLILYAINYSLVSMPSSRPQAAASNALRLGSYALSAPGQTFDVALEMDGAGDVQGLSTQLAWDPAVVEPIRVAQGELIEQQGRLGMVLSPDAGVVDAAVFGVGGGIAGSGTLARVTFRMHTAGDPAIRIANTDARDAQNQPLALSTAGTDGGYSGRTALRMAFPNPFDQSLTIALALAQRGPAQVGVFDVAGRKVRTLISGVQPAGQRLVTWDGRDDSGARLGAGVYMLRLDAGGHRETRAVRLVK